MAATPTQTLTVLATVAVECPMEPVDMRKEALILKKIVEGGVTCNYMFM